MQFASMASLWFALSLPLIIVLYLLKKKYQDTEVSSHLLWQRVLQPQEANRPWQKLKRNLLMLLQLLVAALLVLALMQPAWWTEGKPAEHLVMVFDRSASLQQQVVLPAGDETTMFDLLKTQALDELNQHAPNQLTLLTIGSEPEILLSKSTQKAEWESAIEHLQPHYGQAAYQETMSLASALRHVDGEDVRTIVYTDGRWTEPVSAAEWEVTPQFGLPERELLNEDNLSVMRFGVAENNQTNTVSASAVIRNGGTSEGHAELLLYADGKLEEIQEIHLAANSDETVFFRGLPEAEVYHIRMEASDTLFLDNQAYAFLSTQRETTAWMVGSHYFLEKALQLSGVNVLKSDFTEMDSASLPLTEVDFVIRAFNHTDDTDSADNSELETWLENRPAWIIGSPSGERQAMTDRRYRVADHPVTQHVQLRDSYISHVHTDAPLWGSMEPIVQAGSGTLISAGQAAGNPKLQFHFQLQDSDLPLRSDFPLLVKNAVDWLTEGTMQQLGQSLPMDYIETGFHSDMNQAIWVDEAGNEALAEYATDDDTLIAPEIPGLYRLVEKNEAGDILQSRYLFVSIDQGESHAKYDHFETFIEHKQDAAGSSAVDEDASRYPRSLLPLLAFILLIVIMVEWGVYQRGPSI